MREHARSLSADMAADRVSRDFLESLLDQRVAALADHPGTPLFFGRMDSPVTGDPLPVMYVGRRHVHDGEEGRPLVLDWRAPVSRAFYQAGPADPMGWSRRRRFGFHGGDLTAFVVKRITVGIPGRRPHHRYMPVFLEPPQLAVVGNIAPHQILPGTVPGGPFRPQRTSVEALNRGIADAVLFEARV